ncbi:cytochrome c oxidase subunit II [Rhodopirellula halodulae]|uniref:cytochrome c oxidase subunit II n=1 Tax=Rhodopirellula halodulae TaxID=2894198 RepID=UPI001E60BFA8|nr:cytochrome c oxidase subunit II [Rhodopirellula sp. JC737]MCC9658382.1 cytochrome c oxidase subunit II [Rhodopirellula sp. JC737]
MLPTPSQSALDPAGTGAESIATLFWWMVSGGALIWALVIGLSVYAIYHPGQHAPKLTRRLVIGGGAVFPTIVLTVLLSYGLSMLSELQRPAPDGSLIVEVSGVRWWWRIRYLLNDANVAVTGERLTQQAASDQQSTLIDDPIGHNDSSFAGEVNPDLDVRSADFVESANELHLPVGEPVEFKLLSEDVIHAFWIPALGGKVDMMPGRVNRLKLHPTREGTYRGLCAEYCGTSHTQMMFDVIVHSRDSFDQWLLNQTKAADVDRLPEQGLALFKSIGCGACHTIRGVVEAASVGPELTHFGSRLRLGASAMANNEENLRRWIRNAKDVKPDAAMPSFETLSDEELNTLVEFLGALQ